MTLDPVNINFRCLSCSLCQPDRRETWGRHTVLIVPHVAERLNAPHSSLQKCYYFVDKGIGAIWPNSSVQSQMKLFAGKINPLPPSLPLYLLGLGLLELRASRSHLCLCLRDCHSLCCPAKHTHAATYTVENAPHSVIARDQIY